MIVWPVLLKLDGDDELLYFAAEDELNDLCRQMILADGDLLIDSLGHGYQICLTADHQLEYQLLPTDYSAEDVSLLIQAHEFNAAGCCITKIHFPSVSQAIKALAR
jgi:hypothetical protein